MTLPFTICLLGHCIIPRPLGLPVTHGHVLDRRMQPMTCPQPVGAELATGSRAVLVTKRERCQPARYFLLVGNPDLAEEGWVEVKEWDWVEHTVGMEYGR